MNTKKILGIGNALVDAIVKLPSDDLLKTLNLPKGSMQLVNAAESQTVLQAISPLQPQFTAGGSAANAISGVAHLGIETGFIGMVGKDDQGELFIHAMSQQGTAPLFYISEKTATGCAATLVSPDGERTFATYLGAAIEMTADKLNEKLFQGYHIFHIEGFLVQNQDLIKTAVKMAKSAGCQISIDMASYNTVQENHAFLSEILKDVDIVFANEEEARAFAKTDDPMEALHIFSKTCPYSIVKVGKRGAYLKHDNQIYHFPTNEKPCVDTTGAGDLFAAGFLGGFAMGKSLETCGQMATLLAENIIGVIGAKMEETQWNQIRKSLL